MYLIETRLSAVVPLSVKLEFPICVTVPDNSLTCGSPFAVTTAENDPPDSSTNTVAPVVNASLLVVVNKISAVVGPGTDLAISTACMIPITSPLNKDTCPVFALTTGALAYILFPTD